MVSYTMVSSGNENDRSVVNAGILEVDHWLLPIGGNPVPSVLSILALNNGHNSFYLLPSSQTENTANTIKKVLSGKGITSVNILASVDSRDPSAIYKICGRLANDNRRWGVQYTAGTKAMSVMTSLAMNKLTSGVVLAYLDSYTDSIIVHGPNGDPLSDPIVTQPKLSRDELLSLHGFQRVRENGIRQVSFENAARRMVELNIDTTYDLKCWAGWTTYWRNYRFNRIKDPLLSQNKDLWDKAQPFLTSLESSGIRNLAVEDISWAQLAIDNNVSVPVLRDWLCGGWLENWTLSALIKAKRLGAPVNEAIRCVELVRTVADQDVSGPGKIEVDVVAISGVRLLGVSCTVDRNRAKTKLLENFVRVSQMGGDESLCAMVSCTDANRTDQLRKEADKILRPRRRLATFGLDDLLELENRFLEWLT